TALALEGDFAGARALQRRLQKLMEVMFVESNPGPAKAALGMLGLLEPVYRLPAVLPRPESLAKIEAVLAELGMLDAVPAGQRREAPAAQATPG
ncbi:MAG TPA: dihydrodipicolinate synthase family protein, partial [Caulobacteraceae bacterium]|nr:dihydrodipicolinate synthase family protein [Caulobacteraceae bacterium]